MATSEAIFRGHIQACTLKRTAQILAEKYKFQQKKYTIFALTGKDSQLKSYNHKNLAVKIVIGTLVDVVPNSQIHFLQYILGQFHNCLMLRVYYLFVSVKIQVKKQLSNKKVQQKDTFCTLEYKKRTFLLTGVL